MKACRLRAFGWYRHCWLRSCLKKRVLAGMNPKAWQAAALLARREPKAATWFVPVWSVWPNASYRSRPLCSKADF